MRSPEATLAERIRGEIPDLDRSVARVVAAWQRGKRATADQAYYLDAAALNLHGFYSGVERLFEPRPSRGTPLATAEECAFASGARRVLTLAHCAISAWPLFSFNLLLGRKPGSDQDGCAGD